MGVARAAAIAAVAVALALAALVASIYLYGAEYSVTPPVVVVERGGSAAATLVVSRLPPATCIVLEPLSSDVVVSPGCVCSTGTHTITVYALAGASPGARYVKVSAVALKAIELSYILLEVDVSEETAAAPPTGAAVYSRAQYPVAFSAEGVVIDVPVEPSSGYTPTMLFYRGTVSVGTRVDVYVNLVPETGTWCGYVKVEIRKDVVWRPDAELTVIGGRRVCFYSDQPRWVKIGSFVVTEPTSDAWYCGVTGCVRQFFPRLWVYDESGGAWVLVFDPRDPGSRPAVFATD